MGDQGSIRKIHLIAYLPIYLISIQRKYAMRHLKGCSFLKAIILMENRYRIKIHIVNGRAKNRA